MAGREQRLQCPARTTPPSRRYGVTVLAMTPAPFASGPLGASASHPIQGDENTARANTTSPEAFKAADCLAWRVTTEGETSFWNRVGAVGACKDGKGYTLPLETGPIDGRIVLRAPFEDAPKP